MTKGKVTCPFCRELLPPTVVDKLRQNMIEQQAIRCLLADETQCEWRGTLGSNGTNLVQHLRSVHRLTENSALTNQYFSPVLHVTASPAQRAEYQRFLYDQLLRFCQPNPGKLEGMLDIGFSELRSNWDINKCPVSAMDDTFKMNVVDFYTLFAIVVPSTRTWANTKAYEAKNSEGVDLHRLQAEWCLALEPHLPALCIKDMEAIFSSPDVQETPLVPGVAGYISWCDVNLYKHNAETDPQCIEEVFQIFCYDSALMERLRAKLMTIWVLAAARVQVPDKTWEDLIASGKIMLFADQSISLQRIARWWVSEVQVAAHGRQMLACCGPVLADLSEIGIDKVFSQTPSTIRDMLPPATELKQCVRQLFTSI